MDSLVAIEIFYIVLLGITSVAMAAFAGLVISRLYKGQK